MTERTGGARGLVAWILQGVLAALFAWQGVIKFTQPEGLPEQMEWVYDLSPALSAFVGVVELAAAAGLILPAATGILRWLTPLAAGGLVVLMLGAAVWHVPREEYQSVVFNILVAALAGVVLWLRRELLPQRTAAA